MSSLAELFAKDPEHLTDVDLKVIVEGFRAARANFQTGNKSAGSAKNTGVKKSLAELLGDDF